MHLNLFMKLKITGFSKFEITEKEYNKFLKKSKEEIYICLKKTKDEEIYLEIVGDDLEKIKETVVYIFFKIKKNRFFKTTILSFSKKINKKEIKNIKNEIITEIETKMDNINYSYAPEDLLEITKAKYL